MISPLKPEAKLVSRLYICVPCEIFYVCFCVSFRTLSYLSCPVKFTLSPLITHLLDLE